MSIRYDLHFITHTCIPRYHKRVDPDIFCEFCTSSHLCLCIFQHFVGENGPTKEYQDPISADGCVSTPARKPPKRRIFTPSDNNMSENMRPCGILTENTTM